MHHEIVKRLSDVIANAVKALTKDDHVYVATTGGLAAANEVIHELVRLHCVAGPQVTALEVPDTNRAGHDDQAVPEKFHPAAGIRARWHALDLIEKGNLLAAWGAVSHLEGQPGQAWVQVVRWLANFAASLPIESTCDIQLLTHPRMAVRAALRVELALRAGDIPRAVHGTVAFFESALWDHLLDRFERSTDSKKRRYFKLKPGIPEPDENLIKDGSKDDRTRPFERKETDSNGVQWYWIYDDSACAGRLAEHYLQSEPLKALSDAINKIRDLRNDVAHNEPTPALMKDAEKQMQAAQLWYSNNRFLFLTQSLVIDVLKELWEANPEQLYKRLKDDIRSRLLKI